jgi:predicted transcriptional regulator
MLFKLFLVFNSKILYILNMVKQKKKSKTLVLRTEEQRRAIASPLRLELIGLFVELKPLSVAQMAQRMGRPATAIHYHVRLLEKAGLLRRAGEQRSGSRPEALYMPAAEIFELEKSGEGNSGDPEAMIKALSMAFRMAVGDMKTALEDSSVRYSGPQRNFIGVRMHCRLSKTELAELNRHLREIEKMLSRPPTTPEPSPSDTFISLTMALMPLPNREVQS